MKNEKEFKDFDPSEHKSCPLCNFEMLYIDAENKTTSYMFLNGEIDKDTTAKDLDYKDNDVTGLYCNHVDCGQKID